MWLNTKFLKIQIHEIFFGELILWNNSCLIESIFYHTHYDAQFSKAFFNENKIWLHNQMKSEDTMFKFQTDVIGNKEIELLTIWRTIP